MKNALVKFFLSMQLKNYVKLLVIGGMREVRILQPDVKANGTESGKLKLEDTLQHTIEKEDTYLMYVQG